MRYIICYFQLFPVGGKKKTKRQIHILTMGKDFLHANFGVKVVIDAAVEAD